MVTSLMICAVRNGKLLKETFETVQELVKAVENPTIGG